MEVIEKDEQRIKQEIESDCELDRVSIVSENINDEQLPTFSSEEEADSNDEFNGTFSYNEDVVQPMSTSNTYLEKVKMLIDESKRVVKTEIKKRAELYRKMKKYENKINKIKESINSLNKVIKTANIVTGTLNI